MSSEERLMIVVLRMSVSVLRGGSTSDLDGMLEGSDTDNAEGEDDDSPFVSFTAAARGCPSQSGTEGSSPARSPTTPWRNLDQQVTRPRAFGVMRLGRPSVLGSLYQPSSGSQLDWALINLQDPYPPEWIGNALSLPGSLAKETINGTVSDAELQDPESRREV